MTKELSSLILVEASWLEGEGDAESGCETGVQASEGLWAGVLGILGKRLPRDSQVCSRNTSAVSPWLRPSVHRNSLKPSAEKEVVLLLCQRCVDLQAIAGTRAQYGECLCIEKFTGKSCSC